MSKTDQRVAVYLTEAERAKLDKLAEREGRSRADTARRLLAAALLKGAKP